MSYKVLKAFRDEKNDGKRYIRNDEFKSDDKKRVDLLIKEGYIQKSDKQEEEKK